MNWCLDSLLQPILRGEQRDRGRRFPHPPPRRPQIQEPVAAILASAYLSQEPNVSGTCLRALFPYPAMYTHAPAFRSSSGFQLLPEPRSSVWRPNKVVNAPSALGSGGTSYAGSSRSGRHLETSGLESVSRDYGDSYSRMELNNDYLSRQSENSSLMYLACAKMRRNATFSWSLFSALLLLLFTTTKLLRKPFFDNWAIFRSLRAVSYQSLPAAWLEEKSLAV
jgi:hypothetical protein